jgi:hypothetical protein
VEGVPVDIDRPAEDDDDVKKFGAGAVMGGGELTNKPE